MTKHVRWQRYRRSELRGWTYRCECGGTAFFSDREHLRGPINAFLIRYRAHKDHPYA